MRTLLHFATSLLLLVSCLALFPTTQCNALTLPTTPSPPAKKRATICNGSSDLCDRSYGNVTFAGAHDSYAIGTSLATNQNVSVTTQLESGIRMLQSQAHNSTNSSTSTGGSGIELCHTSCSLFDGGSLESWLSEIKTWVDSNPNDVVSLLIVNSDGLPASQFETAFKSSGLSSKMYSPANSVIPKTDWPTLATLIEASTTVVAFLTLEANHASVPYLLDEFSNIWENPYDQTTYPFNCSIDRIGASASDPSSLMYLSNQFLDSSYLDGVILTPDEDALGTTNSVQGTLSTSETCASQHGSYPNFVLTDYSTLPSNDLVKAVAQMNGVDYIAPNITSTSSSSSPSSSSSSSSSSPSNSPASTNEGATLLLRSQITTIIAFTALLALSL